ncbi:MAG: hypothetical protein HQK52_12680 [Oligoflexia bacterium]|nr:hypothetical protein [Oligoflexia bacterium]
MKLRLRSILVVTFLLLISVGKSYADNSRWQFNLKAKPFVGELQLKSSTSNGGGIRIEVDGSESIPGRKVERTFYGASMSPTDQLPSKLLMQEMPLAFLRIGSSELSRYDFKSTLVLRRFFSPIDAELARSKYYASMDMVSMVKIIRSLNATPMLQMNLLGVKPSYGDNNKPQIISVDSAEEAYDQLYYLNKDHKLDVRYFVIDNEPTIWNGTHFDLIKEPVSADEYITRFVRLVLRVRAASEEIHGDAHYVKIIAPEESQSWGRFQTWSPNDCAVQISGGPIVCRYGDDPSMHFENFLDYFLYKVGKIESNREINPKGYRLLDYFSYHIYPLFRKNYSDPESFILNAKGEQDVTRYLNSIRLWDSEVVNDTDYVFPRGESINLFNFVNQNLAKYYPHAKAVISEFGIDSSGKTIDYHPLLKPLYIGELLALSAFHKTEYFLISYLNSNIFDVKSWPLISEGNKTIPSYYIMSLMSKYFNGNFISSRVSASNDLVAYSVKNKKEIVTIIINKNMNQELPFIYKLKTIGEVGMKIAPLTFIMMRSPLANPAKVVMHRFGQNELGVVDLFHVN